MATYVVSPKQIYLANSANTIRQVHKANISEAQVDADSVVFFLILTEDETIRN